VEFVFGSTCSHERPMGKNRWIYIGDGSSVTVPDVTQIV
jgi:hypothetical protein